MGCLCHRTVGTAGMLGVVRTGVPRGEAVPGHNGGMGGF